MPPGLWKRTKRRRYFNVFRGPSSCDLLDVFFCQPASHDCPNTCQSPLLNRPHYSVIIKRKPGGSVAWTLNFNNHHLLIITSLFVLIQCWVQFTAHKFNPRGQSSANLSSPLLWEWWRCTAGCCVPLMPKTHRGQPLTSAERVWGCSSPQALFLYICVSFRSFM